MGNFRFFQRIPIIPSVLYLNISKKGISFSLGKRGIKLTLGKKGLHATLGIPGTGLFYTEIFKKKKSPKSGR